jgi:hypothetical protein
MNTAFFVEWEEAAKQRAGRTQSRARDLLAPRQRRDARERLLERRGARLADLVRPQAAACRGVP